MTLSGEGEYNLNILKEIEVTDSFFELDNKVMKCQSYRDKGTYDDCTTRYFMKEIRIICGCLPLHVDNATIKEEKVCTTPRYRVFIYYLRFPPALLKEKRHALIQLYKKVNKLIA